jgi:hypothetical protein
VTFDRIFDDSDAAGMAPVAAGLPDADEQAMGFEPPAPVVAEPNQPTP